MRPDSGSNAIRKLLDGVQDAGQDAVIQALKNAMQSTEIGV